MSFNTKVAELIAQGVLEASVFEEAASEGWRVGCRELLRALRRSTPSAPHVVVEVCLQPSLIEACTMTRTAELLSRIREEAVANLVIITPAAYPAILEAQMPTLHAMSRNLALVHEGSVQRLGVELLLGIVLGLEPQDAVPLLDRLDAEMGSHRELADLVYALTTQDMERGSKTMHSKVLARVSHHRALPIGKGGSLRGIMAMVSARVAS